MQELIKVSPNPRGGDGQVVSARDLYEFLEAKAQFSNWCSRMFEYGFEEGKDFLTILLESTGGRPQTDFALTLDTAKEIAMLQRSEKGKQARQYFIECEKQLRNLAPVQPSLPQTYAEALRALAEKIENEERLKSENQKLSAKSEYVDKVLSSTTHLTTTIIAKELGMSARALNKKLCEHGIQYKHQNHYVLYAKYQNRGLAEMKTHQWNDEGGVGHTSHFLVWTELGRVTIHNLLNENLSWSQPSKRKALQQ
jgi:anti-repressor protein